VKKKEIIACGLDVATKRSLPDRPLPTDHPRKVIAAAMPNRRNQKRHHREPGDCGETFRKAARRRNSRPPSPSTGSRSVSRATTSRASIAAAQLMQRQATPRSRRRTSPVIHAARPVPYRPSGKSYTCCHRILPGQARETYGLPWADRRAPGCRCACSERATAGWHKTSSSSEQGANARLEDCSAAARRANAVLTQDEKSWEWPDRIGAGTTDIA